MKIYRIIFFAVFFYSCGVPLSKDEQHLSKLIDIYDRYIDEVFPAVDHALMTADKLVKKVFIDLPDSMNTSVNNIANATNAIFYFKAWDLELSILEYKIKDVENFNCENLSLKNKRESFLKNFYKKKKELDQRKIQFLDFLDKKMKENAPQREVFRI